MTDSGNSIFPPGYEGPYVFVKRKRDAGFWVAVGFAIFFFLCTLLSFTLFLGSLLLSKSVISSASKIDKKHFFETVLEGSGENKIAVITVAGIISNEAPEHLFLQNPSIVELVKQQLEHAAEDHLVKAILLEIDSPGGGITASDILYNRILKFKHETNKKVVVHMKDVAASGGYYIASAADAIIAHPTTITGSIGVIMPLINVTELINRYGIVNNSITSGEMKQLGSPIKEMSQEESAILQNIINEMYLRFVDVVSEGRNLDREKVKQLADGRIYTGQQAFENGLIDQLGFWEDAIDKTKKLAGLTEAKIVRYKKPLGLSELFGLMATKLMEENTIKLDIANLPEQCNYKPMYLWMGQSGNKEILEKW